MRAEGGQMSPETRQQQHHPISRRWLELRMQQEKLMTDSHHGNAGAADNGIESCENIIKVDDQVRLNMS